MVLRAHSNQEGFRELHFVHLCLSPSYLPLPPTTQGFGASDMISTAQTTPPSSSLCTSSGTVGHILMGHKFPKPHSPVGEVGYIVV